MREIMMPQRLRSFCVLVLLLGVASGCSADIPSGYTGTWGCIAFRVGVAAAGSGVCPAGWHGLEIDAGGTYEMGQVTGTVQAADDGEGIRFSDGLEFMGPGRINADDQLEFNWTDADGFSYWAVFIRQ